MIEMDESEHCFSTLTDDELRAIEDVYGPKVKAAFLTPYPVSIGVEAHAPTGTD